MPTLRAVYNPTTHVANVALTGTAVPGGSVAIGNFDHPDPVYPDSTVIYHGVRDLLYKRSASNPTNTAPFPENITDMASVKITVVTMAGLTITAPGGNLAVAATRQSVVTTTPAGAVDAGGYTYTSSDPTKATVSATGLITGVAAGTTVIEVTSADGKHKATVNVTVA